jgi:hypothetical protein
VLRSTRLERPVAASHSSRGLAKAAIAATSLKATTGTRRKRLHTTLGTAAGLALLLLAATAAGSDVSDRGQVEAILATPATVPQVGDGARTAARAALARSAEVPATDAGDRRGRLEALALEWATLARDLELAVVAETDADRLQSEQATIEEEVRRSLALLEEAEARRGRAQANLERALAAGSSTKGAPR